MPSPALVPSARRGRDSGPRKVAREHPLRPFLSLPCWRTSDLNSARAGIAFSGSPSPPRWQPVE
eukprot:7804624-Pyramimonas_sp.AAC.1